MVIDKEQAYIEFYDSLTSEEKGKVYKAIELLLGVVSEVPHPFIITLDHSIYEVNVEVLETNE